MSKKFEIKHFDGKTEVHFDGTFQPGDIAFCGHDLMGDGHLGWNPGKETKKKVNCPACIKLLEYAKTINVTEIEKVFDKPTRHRQGVS